VSGGPAKQSDACSGGWAMHQCPLDGFWDFHGVKSGDPSEEVMVANQEQT
jgi:hypothetical protein